MGKCYNFSFDSAFFFGGANNSRRTYTTNWASVLPEKKAFKVSFAYMSEVGVLPDAIVMCLRTNLGQSNSYSNISPSTSFDSTNLLGFLKIDPLAVSSFYYADYKTNPPIYLNERPTNSILEVELHEGLSTVNYSTPVPSDYVLILHFEEVD
jgi:hypothetical protein